ncbi:MAG: outer membrane protein assembly factor BamB [Gammaproteobacteria bacterium]|nr:outer membrane protein assembly factor BamB [Gammaproteobacteria bacterium]MDP2347391.1 outer membrane protein assembly factor BamB [Gammaproteobacteria bacterium]
MTTAANQRFEQVVPSFRSGRRMLANAALAAVILLTQSACSIFQPIANLFGDDDVERPAELQDFTQELRLNRRWSVKVGNGQGRYYSQLTPAIDREFIYAASADGTVVAVNRSNGNVVWRARTNKDISGGVGAAAGMVLFGTREAEVVALDQISGRELWSAAVSSEVLSAPQTNGNIVVLQTVDGKLIGLEAASGQRRWIYETTIPALTLRGSSKPVLAGNTVIAGFSNGMIAAVNAANGFLLWEERVAIPQGRYDIERVIDVDGDLLLSGNTVFASSYQGNLMGFDVQTGRIVWGMEASSYHGLAQGFGNMYYTNDKSHVIALRNNSDQVVWENADLRLRSLTAPRTITNYVAVADFEGYLHLLSQVDGHFVSRVRVDRGGIRANPVTDADTIYVFGNKGQLSAYSIR